MGSKIPEGHASEFGVRQTRGLHAAGNDGSARLVVYKQLLTQQLLLLLMLHPSARCRCQI